MHKTLTRVTVLTTKRGNFSKGLGVLKLLKPFSVGGGGGFATLKPPPGLIPGPAGGLRGPQTPHVFGYIHAPLTSIPASALVEF